MMDAMNGGHSYDAWTVASAQPDTRRDFIHKTYQTLGLAIAGFIGLEALLLKTPGLAETSLQLMMGSSFSWIVVLGLFMVVSNVANKWAQDNAEPGKATLGLVLYVAAEAILFLPLLTIASHMVDGPQLILKAGFMTAITFFGLTLSVLFTKAELTFLSSFLRVGFFAAFGLIVVALIFGLSLGTWFSAGMVLLAGGSIAYQTSQMVHHYRPGQHIAAALGLFASVALLFWYVLRIFMGSRD